jgi:hypothetical protein
MKTNQMHYLSLIYFVSQPLRVSGMFIARHEEVFTVYPFNAGIKSLRLTLPDENFLLGILLLEPCISLIYA